VSTCISFQFWFLLIFNRNLAILFLMKRHHEMARQTFLTIKTEVMWLKVSNVTWSTSYFYVCADKTNGVLVSNYRKVRYKYIDILF